MQQKSKLYLSILFRQRNINSFSFITITLKIQKYSNLNMQLIAKRQSIQVVICYICTWAREIRSLRKWPEVSPLMASSSDFLYSERAKDIYSTSNEVLCFKTATLSVISSSAFQRVEIKITIWII